jgi:hypothetical protein
MPTFREILEKLKINAAKVLRGKAPEDSLPVVSKDYNDLIEALKALEVGGETYGVNYIVKDMSSYPPETIVISEIDGNLNTDVLISELIVSGHNFYIGYPTRYKIVPNFYVKYEKELLETSNFTQIHMTIQVLDLSDTPVYQFLRGELVPESGIDLVQYFQLQCNIISTANLEDGYKVRVYMKLVKDADAGTQRISVLSYDAISSFYIESTRLVEHMG